MALTFIWRASFSKALYQIFPCDPAFYVQDFL